VNHPAALALVAALAPAQPPVTRWVALGVVGLVAIYLLWASLRCAVRLVGLVLLLALAWLAWSRLA